MFSGKRNLFQKKLEYRILVECTTIENAIFPYKTALPKAKRQIDKFTKNI